MKQYIVHNAADARRAIELNARWIHCDQPDAIGEMIELCREANVILTLESDEKKVMETLVHGVILNPGDTPAEKVREYLGPNAVIGCRVSSLFEIMNLAPLDVDFFVLSAPLDEFGNIVRMARSKGVEQRISALSGDPAYLSAGADALFTTVEGV